MNIPGRTWRILLCCFGPTTSNIQQSTWCVFLTADELNECLFPHRRQTCVIASGPFRSLAGATKRLIYSNFTFRVVLRQLWGGLFRTTAGNRVFAGCPQVTHPKYWLAAGSAPGVILRFTSQWLAKCRPVEKVWGLQADKVQEWRRSSLELLDLILASLSCQAQRSTFWSKLDMLHYILPKAA